MSYQTSEFEVNIPHLTLLKTSDTEFTSGKDSTVCSYIWVSSLWVGDNVKRLHKVGNTKAENSILLNFLTI